MEQEQKYNKILYLDLRTQFMDLPFQELLKIEAVATDYGRHKMTVLKAVTDEMKRRNYYMERI